ncbi:hypothetical protein DRB89_34905 [Streptomyces sp. ICC4]|nr:hypothetical protein DRB89_34905 [Streptomyces sp. ICC4]
MPDHTDRRPQGGIPDGLLVGLLAFLLGLAVLIWTATGLAALFTKGAWPDTVTFTRTPTAVRSLIAQPQDIAAAWPDTAPSALSNWGLFWGLFISQLLVLLVLTIFLLGVVARTKSRRTHPPTPAPPAFEARGPEQSPDPAPGTAPRRVVGPPKYVQYKRRPSARGPLPAVAGGDAPHRTPRPGKPSRPQH